MSGPNLKSILLLLPTLEVEEIRQIKDRVDAILALSPTDSVVEGEDWLGQGICIELRRRGLVRGDAQIRAPDKAFIRDQKEMSEFLVERIGRPLKSVEKAVLGQVAARALADYIGHSAPLSMRTMMQNVSKVPQALEDSFPGYLASGMVEKMIRERKMLTGC